MPDVRSKLAVGLLLIGLAACGSAGASGTEPSPPARVERVPGVKERRIVLTPTAVHRLGLKTARIAPAPSGSTVPYSALIYDPHGRTWVYRQLRPRTFQRARVTVTGIEGDTALLSAGPSVGTRVVSVAAAEVYGTEFFSDHE